MKRIFLVAYALLAPCWISFGQTNSPAAAAPLPPLRTLKMPAAPKQSPAAIVLPANTNALAGQMSLEGNPAKTAAPSRIAQEGLLIPPGPAYSNDFERNMAAAFRPEIIHAGHAQIYSSVVTAVARKNPLCLLDATFLHISF